MCGMASDEHSIAAQHGDLLQRLERLYISSDIDHILPNPLSTIALLLDVLDQLSA